MEPVARRSGVRESVVADVSTIEAASTEASSNCCVPHEQQCISNQRLFVFLVLPYDAESTVPEPQPYTRYSHISQGVYS